MDYLIDTTFLVRRWREGAESAEQRFAEAHVNDSLAIPWIVKAEFLRGAIVAQQSSESVSTFLDRYPTLWPSEETLHIYADTYAELRRHNQLIGPHDLWIASSALEHDLPIVTRNADHFRRVAGLRVVDYSSTP